MAVTRINNNQISDASSGNVYLGINAAAKLQDYSVTSIKLANNLNYGSDLTIVGNLTVQGQTTAIDTVVMLIEDPLMVLASNQTGSPAVDIGFIGDRGTEQNISFMWDESLQEFATVYTNDLVTNTTVNIASYANFHTGNANIAGNLLVNGTTSFVGNITSANVTGNIAAGNIASLGNVSAAGNVLAGNVSVTGNISASNFIGNFAGNIAAPGSNTQILFNDNGAIAATSALTIDKTSNLVSASGAISAVGNVTAGNLVTAGEVNGGSLNINGDGFINGNLVVNGNVTYVNVDDLQVEDPIIKLGTGANGAPLTSNDGKDRGAQLMYYSTVNGQQQSAFMGWDNSSGNMIIASNATVASQIVTVVDFGTLEIGNLYAQNVATQANVSAAGNVMGGNLVASANVVAANLNATILSLTGNVTSPLNVTGTVTAATVNATGNVSAGGNVVATVGRFGNVVISGDNITDTAGRLNINTALQDVDFAVNGSTANLFYVDAGTGTISVGNSTQITNSIMTLQSTNSFVPPRGNTSQRPSTAVAGMFRFNSQLAVMEYYDGAQWITVDGTSFTVIADEQFSGDGVTTVFTLSTASTTAASIVAINGIQQIPTSAYSVSGTTLTFTEAPAPGDEIDVRIITTTTQINGISNGLSGAQEATVVADPALGQTNATGNLLPTANVIYDLGAPSLRWDTFYVDQISASGNIVCVNLSQTSDQTLKQNILPITDPAAVIMALDGVGFEWTNGFGHSYGFIAQQVESVLPEAVITNPTGIKSLNYTMIIPFLVETIKKQAADIDLLKSRLGL